VSFFIVAYLLWQLALPLSYYVGDDKSDERFAWRMFSAFGFDRDECLVQVARFPPTSKWTLLEKQFVSALSVWQPVIRVNPKAIADKLLRALCEKSPSINEVLLVRSCPQDWGPERISGQLRLNCKTGERSGSLHTP